MIRCFYLPNNLIDPPQRYRNKKCNSTARPKIDAWKICFRFFRGGKICIIFQGWVVISGFSRVFFQGQTKSRVFQDFQGLFATLSETRKGLSGILKRQIFCIIWRENKTKGLVLLNPKRPLLSPIHPLTDDFKYLTKPCDKNKSGEAAKALNGLRARTYLSSKFYFKY